MNLSAHSHLGLWATGLVEWNEGNSKMFYFLKKTTQTINKDKINHWFQKNKWTLANNKGKAVVNFLAEMRHNLAQQEGVSSGLTSSHLLLTLPNKQ